MLFLHTAASEPTDFLRLSQNKTGTINVKTVVRSLVESRYNCKCIGHFGDIDWAFRCDNQLYCLSFFVRRNSTTAGSSSTSTTSAIQTFKHFKGVTKSFTSSNFENGKWIRITQSIYGKCDQLSVSLSMLVAA